MVDSPKIVVIGAGWVGILTAVTLVRDGFFVTLAEIDASRVQNLRAGQLPFFEAGLEAAWAAAVASGRLIIGQNEEASVQANLRAAELVILCLYTPSGPEGQVDVTGLEAVTRWLQPRLTPGSTILVKSTVPPGTTANLQSIAGSQIILATSPEFLAESTAVSDAYQPARVVIGVDIEERPRSLTAYAAPFVGRGIAVEWMSTRSAEMVKYASNNFLLVKVSFANELSQIATALGADPKTVLRTVGLDPRIGPRFLEHGLGWGGGCFPKDIRGLQAAARGVGVPTDILTAALKVNYQRVSYYLEQLKVRLGRPLANQRIAVLGLSFKPGTDDTRSSPSLRLIHALLGEGARVTAYDPQVKNRLAADFKEVDFKESLREAVAGTEAVVIATAWPEIKTWAADPQGYQGVILDCRP